MHRSFVVREWREAGCVSAELSLEVSFFPLSVFLGPLFKGQLSCGFGVSGAKNGHVEGRRVWVGYGDKKDD